ncbi:MAG: hypothetical protein AAF539_16885, partial [Planctomycetota bacterium]
MIDLKAGRAVAAIAGDRDTYRSVTFDDHSPASAYPNADSENASSDRLNPGSKPVGARCFAPTHCKTCQAMSTQVTYAKFPVDGCYECLTKHYLAIGLNQIYVADLDALCGGSRQWTTLGHLLNILPAGTTCIVDAGWSLNDVDSVDAAFLHQVVQNQIRLIWILASESIKDVTTLDRCVRSLPKIVVPALGLDFADGQFRGNGEPSSWIAKSDQLGICNGLVLDVRTVGC